MPLIILIQYSLFVCYICEFLLTLWTILDPLRTNAIGNEVSNEENLVY